MWVKGLQGHRPPPSGCTHTHTHTHTQIYFKELALTCEVSKSAGQAGWLGTQERLNVAAWVPRLSIGRNFLFYPANGSFLLRPSTCRMRPDGGSLLYSESAESSANLSQHLHSSLQTGIWPDPWCWVLANLTPSISRQHCCSLGSQDFCMVGRRSLGWSVGLEWELRGIQDMWRLSASPRVSWAARLRFWAFTMTFWDLPGESVAIYGCHFVLQGIFPTQRSDTRLLLWQVDSWLLSHWEAHVLMLNTKKNNC